MHGGGGGGLLEIWILKCMFNVYTNSISQSLYVVTQRQPVS